MPYVIIAIVAIFIAIVFAIVKFWEIVLAILTGFLAASIGCAIGLLVYLFIESIKRKFLGDVFVIDRRAKIKAAVGGVGSAIAALTMEINFGFVTWIWPVEALISSSVIWLVLERGTYKIAMKLSCYLFLLIIKAIESFFHLVVKVGKLIRQVVKHGGIGKYRRAIQEERERIRQEAITRMEEKRRRMEEARRQAEENARKLEAEEAARRQMEEEAKRRERERVAAVKRQKAMEEASRRAKEEAIRKDKESRKLSALDKLRLDKFSRGKLDYINELLELYNRTERASISCLDPTAFNAYDTPYAQIDFALRAFAGCISVSVIFSFEHLVKVVGFKNEVFDWSGFDDQLREILLLAKTEFDVFDDESKDARQKRYDKEDAILSERELVHVENIDALTELRIKELAFRKMYELNAFLAGFESPFFADFSSVYVMAHYANSYGRPCAMIKMPITLGGDDGLLELAFDVHGVIECKIHGDVKKVDTWEATYQELEKYLKLMEIEWESLAKEKKMREEAHDLEENIKAERENAEKRHLEEMKSRTLDVLSENELRSIAHQHRNEINKILKKYDRTEEIPDDAVAVYGTAFNKFEQPYALLEFRLNLIGKLCDFEIYLTKDDVLAFRIGREDYASAEWSGVLKVIDKMVNDAMESGVKYEGSESFHTGLCRIGFLHNFDQHLRQLADVAGVDRIDTSALDVRISKQQREGGVFCDEEMVVCEEEKAKFQVYDTGFKDKDSKRPIYAKYWRCGTQWYGVEFTKGRPRPQNKEKHARKNSNLIVWVGFEDGFRQEQDACKEIVNQLTSAIENGVIDWCHLLYNFRVEIPGEKIRHRQIDLAIVTRKCILLVELKECSHPVIGDERNEWKICNLGTGEKVVVKAGNNYFKNPFAQVKCTRKYLYKFINLKNHFVPVDKINSAVIFSGNLRKGEVDDININTASIHKWFYWGRVSETLDIIRRANAIAGSDLFESKEDAGNIIRNVFGLQEADLAQGVPVSKSI